MLTHKKYLIPFLLAGICMASELVLVPVFNSIFLIGFGYVSLGFAIGGIAVGGFFSSFFPENRTIDRFSIIGAALLLASFRSVLNVLDFSHIPTAIGSWAILLTILIGYFSTLGFALLRSLNIPDGSFARLYGADLLGAATGAAASYFLLGPLNPGSILLICAALLLMTSTLTAQNLRTAAPIGISAIALFSFTQQCQPTQLEFANKFNKSFTTDLLAQPTYSYWDRIGKIDVVDEPSSKTILYEGGLLKSTIYPFDGNEGALLQNLDTRIEKEFWTPGVALPHLLKANRSARSLIIGGAGGQEIKAALMANEQQINVVELSPTFFDLGLSLTKYNGGIFERPTVQLHVSEGRAFLRRHPNDKFDIIQIFSAHAPMGMQLLGAELAAAPLMTTEAFLEYFDHLSEDGILAISHSFFLRQITTAAKAWKLAGRSNFKSHVLLFDRAELTDITPTLLIKAQPWTHEEVQKAKDIFHYAGSTYRLLQDPSDSSAGFLSEDFFLGEMTEQLEVQPFDLRPVTDDRPYFKMLRKTLFSANTSNQSPYQTKALTSILSAQDSLSLPLGASYFLIPGILLLVISMFVVASVYFGRLSNAPTSIPAYFFLLGLGFSILESEVLFFCAPLIGNPQWTMIVVLLTLLMGLAFGAFYSDRLNANVSFGGTALSTWILWLVSHTGPVFYLLSQLNPFFRLALVAALCSALGFFVGIPFPAVMNRLKDRRQVALAWMANGLASSFGMLIGTLASLLTGHSLVLLFSVSCYGLAAIIFRISGLNSKTQVLIK